MKKNGVAVKFYPRLVPTYGREDGFRIAMQSNFNKNDRYCSSIPYVEASEYFELLEKYRCLKRRLAAKKRRDNRRNINTVDAP